MAGDSQRGTDSAQRRQDQVQEMVLRAQKTWEVLLNTGAATVGQTPSEVVWQRGRARLYHYLPLAERAVGTPLLMVYSLINKPYILDLFPGGSFVEFLLRQGFDVYLLDWGIPTDADRHLVLEDYVQTMLPAVVRRIARDSPTGRASILGYCMGGLLVVLYAALHPRAPLDAVGCLATPVDYHRMGLLSTWSDQRFFDVDALVDRLGNIPGEMIDQQFRMLRPASEYSPVQYVQLWQNILNDRYVEQYRAVNKWARDHIPFPGECMRQVTKELSWGNKLVKDELVLGGRLVRLEAIARPFLHACATYDHIVPYESAAPLVQKVGSEDKEEIVLQGGHVSLVAGRNAVTRLWPRVAGWFAARSSPWPGGTREDRTGQDES
jgi:polyhydroxyalkanoate synthase